MVKLLQHCFSHNSFAIKKKSLIRRIDTGIISLAVQHLPHNYAEYQIITDQYDECYVYYNVPLFCCSLTSFARK